MSDTPSVASSPALSNPQMTVDPESLISPEAHGQAPVTVAKYTAADKPLAPVPADLKNVINDEILNAHLKQAGIPAVADAHAREALRESLFVGLQYTALPASDPRFLAHSGHMGMDVDSLKGKLAASGEQILHTQEKGEKTILRLQKNREAQRNAAVAGVGTGLLTGAVGAAVAYLRLDNKITSVLWRSVAAVGVALGTAGILGGITGKYLNSGLKKEEEQIVSDGRGLKAQMLDLDQTVQGIEVVAKEEFMKVHLQRAFTKLAPKHSPQAPATHENQHPQQDAHASADVHGPRIQPHTPVASAQAVEHSASAEAPRMQPYTPVASAHDGAASADGSFAEKHADRTVGGFAAAAKESKAAANAEGLSIA